MNDDREIVSEKVREFEARTGHSVDSWPDDAENTASVLRENRRISPPMPDERFRSEMSKHTRRSFVVGGLAAVAAILGWRSISEESRNRLFRSTFELNESVSQALYSPGRLAAEFAEGQITTPRLNGFAGMEDDIDIATWRLSIGGLAGRSDDLKIGMEDVVRLPRTEMITELKCIEGWSYIAKWAGVRFSDFMQAYRPSVPSPSYVSISTPNDGYFVGWDIPSILHPQTILAYELNGQPLTKEHGAPLRIASPLKYGIKQIKRIGRIEFTNERPRDYWAESGYDWYSGH